MNYTKPALILWVFMIFAAVSALAKDNPYAVKFPRAYAAVTLNPSLKIIPKYQEKIFDKYFYTTQMHYPKLQSGNKALDQAFNEAVQNALKNIVAKFKKNLDAPKDLLKSQIPSMALTTDSNALNVDYDLFYVKKFNVISVRFIASVGYYLAAHPFSFFVTLNFDVPNKKILQLSDLFQNNNYLYQLQNLSRDKIKKQIAESSGTPPDDAEMQMLNDGTALKPENFKNWNLTNEGLLLNFDPYQVAAYALGPQFVMIDYASLAKMGFHQSEGTNSWNKAAP